MISPYESPSAGKSCPSIHDAFEENNSSEKIESTVAAASASASLDFSRFLSDSLYTRKGSQLPSYYDEGSTQPEEFSVIDCSWRGMGASMNQEEGITTSTSEVAVSDDGSLVDDEGNQVSRSDAPVSPRFASLLSCGTLKSDEGQEVELDCMRSETNSTSTAIEPHVAKSEKQSLIELPSNGTILEAEKNTTKKKTSNLLRLNHKSETVTARDLSMESDKKNNFSLSLHKSSKLCLPLGKNRQIQTSSDRRFSNFVLPTAKHNFVRNPRKLPLPFKQVISRSDYPSFSDHASQEVVSAKVHCEVSNTANEDNDYGGGEIETIVDNHATNITSLNSNSGDNRETRVDVNREILLKPTVNCLSFELSRLMQFEVMERPTFEELETREKRRDENSSVTKQPFHHVGGPRSQASTPDCLLMTSKSTHSTSSAEESKPCLTKAHPLATTSSGRMVELTDEDYLSLADSTILSLDDAMNPRVGCPERLTMPREPRYSPLCDTDLQNNESSQGQEDIMQKIGMPSPLLSSQITSIEVDDATERRSSFRQSSPCPSNRHEKSELETFDKHQDFYVVEKLTAELPSSAVSIPLELRDGDMMYRSVSIALTSDRKPSTTYISELNPSRVGSKINCLEVIEKIPTPYHTRSSEPAIEVEISNEENLSPLLAEFVMIDESQPPPLGHSPSGNFTNNYYHDHSTEMMTKLSLKPSPSSSICIESPENLVGLFNVTGSQPAEISSNKSRVERECHLVASDIIAGPEQPIESSNRETSNRECLSPESSRITPTIISSLKPPTITSLLPELHRSSSSSSQQSLSITSNCYDSSSGNHSEREPSRSLSFDSNMVDQSVVQTNLTNTQHRNINLFDRALKALSKQPICQICQVQEADTMVVHGDDLISVESIDAGTPLTFFCRYGGHEGFNYAVDDLIKLKDNSKLDTGREKYISESKEENKNVVPSQKLNGDDSKSPVAAVYAGSIGNTADVANKRDDLDSTRDSVMKGQVRDAHCNDSTTSNSPCSSEVIHDTVVQNNDDFPVVSGRRVWKQPYQAVTKKKNPIKLFSLFKRKRVQLGDSDIKDVFSLIQRDSFIEGILYEIKLDPQVGINAGPDTNRARLDKDGVSNQSSDMLIDQIVGEVVKKCLQEERDSYFITTQHPLARVII